MKRYHVIGLALLAGFVAGLTVPAHAQAHNQPPLVWAVPDAGLVKFSGNYSHAAFNARGFGSSTWHSVIKSTSQITTAGEEYDFVAYAIDNPDSAGELKGYVLNVSIYRNGKASLCFRGETSNLFCGDYQKVNNRYVFVRDSE